MITKNKRVLHIGQSIHGGGAESVLKNIITILKNHDDNFEQYLLTTEDNTKSGLVDFTFENSNSTLLDNIFSYSNYKC